MGDGVVVAIVAQRGDALDGGPDGPAGRREHPPEYVLSDDGTDVALGPAAVVDGVDEEARIDQSVDGTGCLREAAVAVPAVRGHPVDVPYPIVGVEVLADRGVRRREVQEGVPVRAHQRRSRVGARARRARGIRDRAVVAGDPELDDEALSDHTPGHGTSILQPALQTGHTPRTGSVGTAG